MYNLNPTEVIVHEANPKTAKPQYTIHKTISKNTELQNQTILLSIMQSQKKIWYFPKIDLSAQWMATCNIQSLAIIGILFSQSHIFHRARCLCSGSKVVWYQGLYLLFTIYTAPNTLRVISFLQLEQTTLSAVQSLRYNMRVSALAPFQ